MKINKDKLNLIDEIISIEKNQMETNKTETLKPIHPTNTQDWLSILQEQANIEEEQ